MTEREQVIAELMYLKRDCLEGSATDDTLNKAIALIKAQEPRVMTLAEVEVSINPVWIEGGMAGGTWAMMPKTLERSIEFVGNGVFTLYPAFAIDEYNKTWRCWTSRPTDEQRQAVRWP